MAGSVRIRRFEPRDADAVWNVHEAALRASGLTFVEDAAVDDDVTAIEQHYLEECGEFLVGALEAGDQHQDDRGDEQIVAIGGYLPVDDETVEIERMRVHPEHQREGHASRILEELETRARERGFEVAVLETIEPLAAARAFYEDAGYAVVDQWVQEVTGDARYRYRKAL